jgi:ABC-type dipeptide/oligopeptide/nickel transport system permease subunit
MSGELALLRSGRRALMRSMTRFRHYLGLSVLTLVLSAATLGPLSGYLPGQDVDVALANLGPNTTQWLGTDHLGRDVFWRLVFACQAFVGPGIVACVTTAVLAIPAGALAGYLGGYVASAIRFVTTVLASVPRFVLVLLVCSIYGTDLMTLAFGAGLAYAPTLSEAIYTRIEALRSSEYLLANRAYGVPPWRILVVHLILASCGRLMARHLVLLFGYFVVLETTLAYIGGFGVQEPQPSWGNMLAFEWGRGTHPVTMMAPMIALVGTVLAASWIADALSESHSHE